MKSDITKLTCRTLCVVVALLLAACGGGVGSPNPTSPGNRYTVGGMVSGLSGAVVLQNNHGDNLSVTHNGAFTFANPMDSGSAYSVAVYSQPAGQSCTVTNGSGTISGTVTNVAVSCAAAQPAGTGNSMGINIGSPLYFDPGLVYADAARQNGIGPSYGSGADPSVDSNGWPTVAAFRQWLWSGIRGTQGTYTVWFDGTADVTVANVASYTAPVGAGNTKSFTFTITDEGVISPWIEFTNAHRPDGAPGLTNIRVMRPATQGGATSQPPTAIMSAALKAQIKRGFKTLRFMDFQATNFSQITTWGGRPWQPGHAYNVGDVVTMKITSNPDLYGNGRVYRCEQAGTSNANPSGGPDTATWGGTVSDGTIVWRHVGWGRPLPTWNNFQNNIPANFSAAESSAENGASFGWQGMGGPLEHIVLFANELNDEGYPVDVWVHLPHQADDDYITKMAQLFAFGSDGAMPYTSPQAHPVYPPLNPNAHIYVEYSNEVWLGGFTQQAWVDAHALADGVLDFDRDTRPWDATYNYDRDNFDYTRRYRHVARQIVKASNAFRAAFGDAAMAAGRVRPVIMGQLGWWAISNSPALKFIHDYYGNGDGIAHVAAPHPVSWYVWGTGGAPYLAPSDTTSVTGMLTTGGMTTTSLRSAIMDQARMATVFGVKLVAYEGGPELPGLNASEAEARLSAAANMSATMKDRMMALHNQWSAVGGDLWTYFQSASGGNAPCDWSFAGEVAGHSVYRDVADDLWLSSPKLDAVTELAATAPVLPSIGDSGFPTPAYAINSAAAVNVPGDGTAMFWPDNTYTQTGSGNGARSLNPALRQLAGYAFLVQSAGTRTVSITLSGVAAGAKALLYWNGAPVGATTAGASGTFTFPGVAVRAGLNGLLVNGNGGAFTVESLSVQ